MTELDLNEGGVIHDVAYDKYNGLFIVVGDFTSIGGELANNIAFINDSNFTVNENPFFNIVTSVNGPIYSVEFYSNLVFEPGPTHKYYIYLGGAFTNVNGFSKNGCAKLNYSKSGFYSPCDHYFNLDFWNPDISEEMSLLVPAVFDLKLKGDTIVIGGSFGYTNEGEIDVVYGPLVSYNVLTNTTLPSYPNLPIDFLDVVTHLHFFNGNLYVSTLPDDFYVVETGEIHYGGSGQLIKSLTDGSIDPSFSGLGGSVSGHFQMIGFDETELMVQTGLIGGGDSRGVEVYVRNAETGDYIDAHTFNFPDGPTPARYAMEMYKGDMLLFNTATEALVMYAPNGLGENPSVKWSIPFTNNDLGDELEFTEKDHLFIERNVLFASTSDLDETDGEPRTGLAVYCLEPADIQNFTIFDTTICQSDTLTYTVAQVDYADGYIWEYTGNGINIGATGAPENLSDTLHNMDVDAWTRQISFSAEFTPGELKVTPFSNCNNNLTDGIIISSNTISINIDTNPLPNAFAGNDTTLTCDRTEVLLHGHSDTLDVVYEWNKLGGHPVLDLHPFQDSIVDSAQTYILTVINDIGCLNTDTVIVTMDTLRPNFDPILGPFDLTCSDTVRTYLGFCNNLTDTTSYWRQLSTGDTLDNPIDVTLPGQYQFYTVNNENGCIDSLNMPIFVYLNQPSPNIVITGYDDIPVDEPLDTINCYMPSLTLECYSDTASTILNWVEADSTDPIGTIIDITEGGNYYILAQNTENGCFNYVGLNIAADFAKPNVILPEITALNCSNDSLVLDGSTIFIDTLMEWTGDGISPSPNPLIIFDAGLYYLTVTKNVNGCSEVDSLDVISDSSIDVFAGNDTIGCDESLLFLDVIYGGTISGISYLWDNGTTDAAAVYTAGIDDYAVVEVFGDDDCYGFDTVYIAIPPVPAIEFEAFQPCGDGATGSIIASPISGLAPFEYSIDGGATFQDSPAITGLDFGTYTITVKDSLDCLYEYSAVIDETSDLPTPLFIFSTYNFQMDTVIVVDVSNPPTDSVQWVFSEELEYVDDLDGSPLVALPETGSFIITMDAYYGDCLVSLTKEIFVSDFDSTFASFTNQNGIKSIDLYPNPTNGTFTAEIEFYKKQRVAMGVQDMLGYVYEERLFDEVDELVEVFELGPEAVNGTYVLHIISEFDSAYITFILSR
ncbi:MAG: hypothetical protein GQ574_17925 [Crocinitomix sp.]|nr:hypothetical protein [Crocinitomix sp.]